METQRQTKEVKVGEHTVVIKSYATGREFNDIQSVYLRSAKINMVGNAPQISGFSADVEIEATKKAMEILVVSLDGSTENVFERVENLPYEEYQQIVEHVNALIGKKK